MNLDDQLLARLDLKSATELELTMSNRLMPRRPDRAAISDKADAVQRLLRNGYKKGRFGDVADVVFVDKNRRGRRPISEMTLRDRVLFRALVTLISESLPPHLVRRIPNADFKLDPLLSNTVKYVSKTDIVSYYEFVDHGRLADELEAQTGEAPAVEVLMELLFRIMGRRVGLPQVHRSSDILGDTYIDPVRRRLRRAGFEVTTYSDDFRIATATLAEAREALEACAREVRSLGLALSEGKTFTYSYSNYVFSLTAFKDAERKLFEDSGGESDDITLLFLDDYPDESADPVPSSPQTLGDTAPEAVNEEDVLASEATTPSQTPTISQPSVTPAQEQAARKAWEIWLGEYQSEDQQSKPEAAITETLVGRALPILGRAGVVEPVRHLSHLLRHEPALTPHIASYIKELATTGSRARTALRLAMDGLVEAPILSTWQKIWLADAAASIRPTTADKPHYRWLESCVEDPEPALAATAAAALGQLGRGDLDKMTLSLDRVGPVWRSLVLWAIAKRDHAFAETVSDDLQDRILLDATAS